MRSLQSAQVSSPVEAEAEENQGIRILEYSVTSPGLAVHLLYLRKKTGPHYKMEAAIISGKLRQEDYMCLNRKFQLKQQVSS